MDASTVASEIAASAVTVEDLAMIGINPQDIATVFAWGFGTVVLFWATGYVIALAISLIRKI